MPERETIADGAELAWQKRAIWLLLRDLAGGSVVITDEMWGRVPAEPELIIDRADGLMRWTARERTDEKGAARPSITVDLNVRSRKHETISGFEDVTGADPASLRWGDRILAVEYESGICAEAVVTAADTDKQLVYLVPDWHGWRDLETARPVVAADAVLPGEVPLPFPEPEP